MPRSAWAEVRASRDYARRKLRLAERHHRNLKRQIAIEPTEPWSAGLTVGEAREERLARNEIAFRSVNERIQEMAVSFGGDDYEFVCECSARSCIERVVLTRSQYEHVRAEGTRFFVMPGHENVAVEEVVETQPTYLVVEKDGHAGIVADLADPRDGDS